VPTADKDNDRFGQPRQSARTLKLLKPTFEDYHYKFSLLLPLSAQIIYPRKEPLKKVFKTGDFEKLEVLFDDDIGGYTKVASKKDPMIGAWLTPDEKIVINEHAQYEIYTQRHPKAIEWFRTLKQNLEVYKEQKVLVIEQTEVTFVPAGPNLKQLLRKLDRSEKKKESLEKQRDSLHKSVKELERENKKLRTR